MVIEPIELNGGGQVWVRAVLDTDASELQRAFALLSDVSRYRRFLTGTPTLSDNLARHFTDVDHVLMRPSWRCHHADRGRSSGSRATSDTGISRLMPTWP